MLTGGGNGGASRKRCLLTGEAILASHRTGTPRGRCGIFNWREGAREFHPQTCLRTDLLFPYLSTRLQTRNLRPLRHRHHHTHRTVVGIRAIHFRRQRRLRRKDKTKLERWEGLIRSAIRNRMGFFYVLRGGVALAAQGSEQRWNTTENYRRHCVWSAFKPGGCWSLHEWGGTVLAGASEEEIDKVDHIP